MLRSLGALAIVACSAQFAVSQEMIAYMLDDAQEGTVVEILGDDPPIPDVSDDDPAIQDNFCMTCCEPQWAARADWVFLKRTNLGNDPLLVLAGPNDVLLDASSLGFNFQSGVDLALVYDGTVCSGLEVRYLWIDDWTSNAQAVNPGLVVFGTTPPTGPFINTTFDTAYRSQFNSAEINRRHALGRSTLLYGFRYGFLNEDLSMIGTGGAPQVDFLSSTRNDLYGFQLGIERDLYCTGAFSIDGFAKAGIYYNDSSANIYFADGGVPVNNIVSTDGDVAFLAEAGLNVTWQLKSNLAVRAGYRLLVVDGVAIAADQVAQTGNVALPNAPLAIDANGTMFAHGLNVGFELSW